jgi:hypothetical protein
MKEWKKNKLRLNDARRKVENATERALLSYSVQLITVVSDKLCYLLDTRYTVGRRITTANVPEYAYYTKRRFF